jgi:hypothetical protein
VGVFQGKENTHLFEAECELRGSGLEIELLQRRTQAAQRVVRAPVGDALIV